MEKDLGKIEVGKDFENLIPYRMKKLKIFLTGGTGFIARNIVEQLGNKYYFISPSHKRLNLLDLEAVGHFFRKNKFFDVVIHTANIGGNRKNIDGSEVVFNNLQMFFNLARNQKYYAKMINLGSGAEYGKQHAIKKIREENFDERIPEDGYGFYKYLCAKYIKSCDKMINLRLFGIYGKYEDWTIRFISNAICKSIFGLPITINKNVYFDYLYIDDFVDILDYFTNHKTQFNTYNVCRGDSINLLTIAKKINKLSFSVKKFAQKKSKIIVSQRGLGNEYTANNTRLLNEIGLFKFKDFDLSLIELYTWYQNNRRSIKRAELLDDHF